MLFNTVALTPLSSATSIVASVTPTTAALTLLQTTLPFPSKLSVVFGGDSAKFLTVTGKDERGLPITEVITSAGAGTVVSSNYYTSLTTIQPSAAFASTVTVGTNGQVATLWQPHDTRKNPFAVSLYAYMSVGASLTYTIQHTLDDIFNANAPIRVLNHDVLNAQTGGDDGNYAFPISASRMIVTAYTSGSIEYKTRQAG